MKNRVFISYSHEDRRWLEELQTHLRPLEREGIISRWDDTLIQSGSEWRKEIRQALSASRIAVLLVSKHFLASDFIAKNELPPLLLASQRDGTLILPVIIGPCRFDRTPGLSEYQAINDPRRTLLELSEAERDRVWLDITYAIETSLERVPPQASTSSAPQKPDRPHSKRQARSATIAPVDAEPETQTPDLYLFVRTSMSARSIALSFQLKARDSNLEIPDTLFGPIELKTDPRRYFAEFFSEIERLPTGDANKEVALRKLEAKGSALFSSVLPEEVANILWRLQDQVASLVVVSDEGVVPWELFKLTKKSPQGVEVGPYLCEAFAMTRWPSGFPFLHSLSLKNTAVVHGGWLGDRKLSDPSSPLQATAEHRVTAIPSRYLDVYDALVSGQYDGIHFTAHGAMAAGGEHPRWRLLLDDNTVLSPEDLLGQAGNLARSHPLVFLNACHTGLNAETLTRISGWGIEFIRAGAAAFIGSYWSLRNETATLFEEEFYRNILSGVPFGDSVRRARLSVRSEFAGPDWLAYAAYGHPFARTNGREN